MSANKKRMLLILTCLFIFALDYFFFRDTPAHPTRVYLKLREYGDLGKLMENMAKDNAGYVDFNQLANRVCVSDQMTPSEGEARVLFPNLKKYYEQGDDSNNWNVYAPADGDETYIIAYEIGGRDLFLFDEMGISQTDSVSEIEAALKQGEALFPSSPQNTGKCPRFAYISKNKWIYWPSQKTL